MNFVLYLVLKNDEVIIIFKFIFNQKHELVKIINFLEFFKFFVINRRAFLVFKFSFLYIISLKVLNVSNYLKSF